MESPKRGCDFRALRSKTQAFKKRIAIVSCDLKTSLGATPNQTKESEVSELLGEESGIGSGTPFCL